MSAPLGRGSPRPCPARPPREAFALHRRGPAANTTLAVVATDATLTKTQCAKLAMVAHDGFARALDPVHTDLDGDLVFGASTRRRPAPDGADLHDLLVAAATVTARAIGRAVLAARSVSTPAGSWPGLAGPRRRLTRRTTRARRARYCR